MKTLIIYPNEEWMISGGARIRYKRLQPFLSAKSMKMIFSPIERVSIGLLQEAAIVIIVKVFSLDSLRIISFCKSRGICVGFDIFDDYFSDPSLNLLHDKYSWIKIASMMSDFLICSTDRMRSISAKFISTNLIHKIQDTHDPNILQEETNILLNKKIHSWKTSGHLNILWFGIGDNPYFDIGIKNLANYSNSLFQIREHFESYKFTLLTNKRALTPENLSFISNLPAEVNIEIWSPQLEDRLLREAHIALLPVSHQQFSIAKSSNRCITALSYGCQVLSNGYNLYKNFSNLIYDSTEDLINAYNNCDFKLSNNSLANFREICKNNYNTELEAYHFIEFIMKRLGKKRSFEPAKITALHFNMNKQQLKTNFPINQFPIINAKRIARSGFCNFGIEKYDNKNYIQFSDNCEIFLLAKWKEHLEKIYLENYTISQINVETVRSLAPTISKDIDIILNYRHRRKDLNLPAKNAKQRVLFLFVSKPLASLLETMFNCKYTYLTDLMSEYQVAGERP